MIKVKLQDDDEEMQKRNLLAQVVTLNHLFV